MGHHFRHPTHHTNHPLAHWLVLKPAMHWTVDATATNITLSATWLTLTRNFTACLRRHGMTHIQHWMSWPTGAGKKPAFADLSNFGKKQLLESRVIANPFTISCRQRLRAWFMGQQLLAIALLRQRSWFTTTRTTFAFTGRRPKPQTSPRGGSCSSTHGFGLHLNQSVYRREGQGLMQLPMWPRRRTNNTCGEGHKGNAD